MSTPIAVVVPVYRNLELTRRCLNSLFASDLPDQTRIIIVDDASPEAELSDYCATLASEAAVIYHRNPENGGFVYSANQGMALAEDCDVVLLNSDTEVYGDWLQRMKRTAYAEDRIGTVTPFSNNATVCSYPLYLTDNELPAEMSGAELDACFAEANAGLYTDLPTAVGFCMYIRQDCQRDVGVFDEENFGQGYGEECDFSMRAAGKGWRNVIAADVFVRHAGAASFGKEEAGRKAQADEIMDRLHPGYAPAVGAYIHDDPLLEFRHNVSTLRALRQGNSLEIVMGELADAARHSAERGRKAYEELRSTQSRLKESMEHNAWFERENEKLAKEAFEGREYRRLYDEAQEHLAQRDRGIEQMQTLLDKREADLGQALEKAIWFEKQYGETLQQVKWLEEQHAAANQRADTLVNELTSSQSLLDSARAEFQRTDAALAETQAQFSQALERNNALEGELEQTRGAQIRAEQELTQIKNSRVWRYTAWLRK